MILECKYTFECDDKIAPYIIELNEIGYKTDFCCSGHSEKGELDTEPYISFLRVPSNIIHKGIGAPSNWTSEYEENHLVIRRHYRPDELQIFTIDQLINISMQELKHWVKSLKPINLYESVEIKRI